MKAINRILKTITISLKCISKVGSSPIKFVFNKQKKLVEIISSSNIKIIAVKRFRAGRKIIVTIVFLVTIICSSGVEHQKVYESSCIIPAKMSIERVIEVPNGGAVNRPWSPGAKYAGNSSKTSSGKAPNLRGRRLLSIPGSDSHSRSNSGQQLPNPGYKSAPSVNDNIPKSGRGIRVRSIAKTDENGELKIISYNKDGQIIDGPAESKFLDDVDLVSDGSQNPTYLNRPKCFEKVTDDFENRLTKQKVLNQHESKLLRRHGEHRKRVNRFNKMLQFLNSHGRPSRNVNLSKSGLPHKKTTSVIKQEKIGSNVNSLGRSEWRSPLFGMKEKTIVSAAPSSQESNITPTPNLFAADSVTGEIQNINIAFNQFKERMTQIGSNYTGKKQEYFFEQLNQCDIERFKALSTEKGRLTIYGMREAETMLQSEFEGFHEPNSITRATKAELEADNPLDGRFRKGLLSGQLNTLNEDFTDLDTKVLVSTKTLHHQANERKNLGRKNPDPLSMYEQGETSASSIISQKFKHCDSSKVERPSSPKNVKHIVNLIELSVEETHIAKAGIIKGSKDALADKLGVDQEYISDKMALQGTLFLNEDYTIERIN